MKQKASQIGFTDRIIKEDTGFTPESLSTIDKPTVLPPERIELEKAIEYIGTLNDDWNGFNAKRVTELSINAGKRLIGLIPLNRLYPNKVSPDGEGGLVFSWNPSKERILLTVEGSIMHLSYEKEGSPDKFIDDVAFDFSEIPGDILSYLPVRKPSR